MRAIFKRELRAYFCSPAGYVCIAALTALYGFFYYQVMLTGSSAYVTAVYAMLFTFGMLLIPVLTMKSMAEERKNRTDQALLTAPLDTWQIVTGKFLACFFVYFTASTAGLLPAAVIEGFADPPWGLILGNYLGTLLYGSAMTAIGICISCITASQMIAAVATFAAAVFLMYLDTAAAAVQLPFLSGLVESVSFYARYSELTRGIFSLDGAVYFMSLTALFLWLGAEKLESTRYAVHWRWKSIRAVKTALALGIVILVNTAAGALTERFPSVNIDMTAQRLNTWSEEAEEIIRQVREETHVYILAGEEESKKDQIYAEYGISYSQIVQLLERAEELNRNILVEFREPEANPELLGRYAEENLQTGDILLETKKRHRVLRIGDLFVQKQEAVTGSIRLYSTADSALANGLAYVDSERVPCVTVAAGHGEMLDEAARAPFVSRLEQNAFEVKTISFLTDEIPEETEILFLPAPTRDYTQGEIEKLNRYLTETKGVSRTLLYAAYPSQGELPMLEGFLEDWGIRIGAGSVCETDSARMLLASPDIVFVREGEMTFADQGYTRLVAPSSSPLELLFSSNDGIYAASIWETAETACVQTEEGQEGAGESQCTAAFSYRKNEGEEQASNSNVIVIGSAQALASPYIDSDSFENGVFMSELMKQVTGTRSRTEAVPRETELNAMDITASKETIDFWGIGIFTAALPLGILGSGAAVYLRRRHL